MSMAFFRRFPRLVWRPGPPDSVVRKEEQAPYAQLQGDFRTLEQELLPVFQKYDGEALDLQNQFRLTQVTLIFGALLAATLGGVQAAFPKYSWLGWAEALIAVVLGAVAWRGAQIRAQEGFLTSRLKAERLRSEYFLFLGRVGPYAGNDADRLRQLRIHVADIETGEKIDE